MEVVLHDLAKEVMRISRNMRWSLKDWTLAPKTVHTPASRSAYSITCNPVKNIIEFKVPVND